MPFSLIIVSRTTVVLDFANSTVTLNRDGKFYKLVAAQTEQQFSGQPVSDDHVEINSDSPGLIDFDDVSDADVIMTETEKLADESPAEIPAEPATANLLLHFPMHLRNHQTYPVIRTS